MFKKGSKLKSCNRKHLNDTKKHGDYPNNIRIYKINRKIKGVRIYKIVGAIRAKQAPCILADTPPVACLSQKGLK